MLPHYLQIPEWRMMSSLYGEFLTLLSSFKILIQYLFFHQVINSLSKRTGASFLIEALKTELTQQWELEIGKEVLINCSLS